MKIAIVSDTFFPEQVNGVAKSAYSDALSLRRHNHEVKVISVKDVPTLPFGGYKGERFALPLGRAYKEIKSFRPDIIHTHTAFTLGWEAVVAAKRLKIPLVGTHHTFFDHYLKHLHMDSPLSRLLSWKYLVSHYNRYNLVLSPSAALLSGMKAHGLTSKSLYMPNAIDTDFFTPIERVNNHTLIYMGRVSYEKSIDKVLEAFKFIRELSPNAQLMIVGDGPERAKLESLARKLGVEESVIFAGMLHGEELVEALQNADVFLTASKSENMPLSVLEAMSTGLPIVGVDALGLPEIIQDGVNGYIVAPDDARSMAEKAVLLLEDSEQRKKFSQASRELALKYTEAEHAKELEKIYENLLIS